MGHLKLLFITFSIILSSCSTITSEGTIINYDYDLVSEKIIPFNTLINISPNNHLVYIFSKSCGHCSEIKEKIIKYSLNKKEFYYVEYIKEIPICIDVENTIGTSCLDTFCIKGTPTLVVINDGKISKNIAGTAKIVDYLYIK